MENVPDTRSPSSPPAQREQLRRAEAVIVRLRWLAMASWPVILATTPRTVPEPLVWAAYAVAVAYTAATHWLNHGGRAVRATALATTFLDPAITALACAVTGGLSSRLYPFFYATTLATSIRFGMRETLATVGLTAALSAVLLAAPGSRATAGDLALAAFFVFFVALEGGLLSRAARQESRRRQQLLWRLMHAEEEERRRLAGEIHDRLGHRFFELHHAIESARADAARRDPTSAATLAGIGDAARACADEIRSMTNALRPAVLDDFGFIEALREHVASQVGRGEPAVTLVVDAPEPREQPAVRVMLFRVLQEALLNVRKHAHAAHVQVSFTASNGTTVLAIRDDGRGFDPHAVRRGHLGLVSMRERAGACGARLDVESRPGSGTEVRVSVPSR